MPAPKINRARAALPVAKILPKPESPYRRSTDGGHLFHVRPSVKRGVDKNRFHHKRVSRLRSEAKRQAASLMLDERAPLRVRVEVPTRMMGRVGRIARRRRERE